VTTRLFPPEDLRDLVDDVIFEITHHRHLLPEIPRVRSFAREQKQPGGRFPRQTDDYKKPLPPKTKIIFWRLTTRPHLS
jgi:hypothetical protein